MVKFSGIICGGKNVEELFTKCLAHAVKLKTCKAAQMFLENQADCVVL